MKRTAIILATILGILGVSAGLGTAYAATTKPVYATPGSVTVAFYTPDNRDSEPDIEYVNAEAVFVASPYANFYKVQVSTSSKFTASTTTTINSQDVNANAITVPELELDTKYYYRVAVTNYEGDRLSSYSRVKSDTTPTEGYFDGWEE